MKKKIKPNATIQEYLSSITPYFVEESRGKMMTTYSREDVIKIMEEYGEQRYDLGHEMGYEDGCEDSWGNEDY